jgi:Co/Zn/Cd efflux system component
VLQKRKKARLHEFRHAAVGLTTMKIVVGVLTGSLGILAEAAHSGLDLVAALVTFLAVRIFGRPADQEHLYGHGKVENLSPCLRPCYCSAPAPGLSTKLSSACSLKAWKLKAPSGPFW